MSTQPVYSGTPTSMTVTNLHSRGDTEFWQSAKVDNSTDLYMGIDLFVTLNIESAAGGDATGYANVYMAESPDGGTNFSGNASGTESQYNPDSIASTHAKNLRRIGRIEAPGDVARDYNWNKRIYDLPDNWAIVIENQTGEALESSGNSVEYQGINYQDA